MTPRMSASGGLWSWLRSHWKSWEGTVRVPSMSKIQWLQLRMASRGEELMSGECRRREGLEGARSTEYSLRHAWGCAGSKSVSYAPPPGGAT